MDMRQRLLRLTVYGVIILLTACQQANEAVQLIADAPNQTTPAPPTSEDSAPINENVPSSTVTEIVREIVVEKEKIVEVRVEVPAQSETYEFPNEAIAKNPLAPPIPPPAANVPVARDAVYNRIAWVAGIYAGSGYRDGASALLLREKAGFPTFNNLNLAKVYRDNPTLPTLARFNGANSVVHHHGILYVSDTGNHRIRRYDLATGQITTFAGQYNTSSEGPYCTDGPGHEARILSPQKIAMSPDGTYLYIPDGGNNAIRRVRLSDGLVETVAGPCTEQPPAEKKGSVDAVGSAARFIGVTAVAVDADHTVYVADRVNGENGAIRKISPNGVVTTFINDADPLDLVPGANPIDPIDVALGNGYLYWSDNKTQQVYRVQVQSPGSTVEVVMGTYKRFGPTWIPPHLSLTTQFLPCVDPDPSDPNDPDDNGSAFAPQKDPAQLPDGVRLRVPSGIFLDGDILYATDSYTGTIWQANLTTVDGNGKFAPMCRMIVGRGGYNAEMSSQGDFRGISIRDGDCELADLSDIRDLTKVGNQLYVSDTRGGLTRVTMNTACKVDFISGQLKDVRLQDGLRDQARFQLLGDLAQLPNGDLILADQDNLAIRRIRFDASYAKNGQLTVETVAGAAPSDKDYNTFSYNASTWGFPVIDDSTTGTNARFYTPRTVAVDAAGKHALVMGNDYQLRIVVVDDNAPNYGATKTVAGACSRVETPTYWPAENRICKGKEMADGLGAAARFASPLDIVAGRDAEGNEVFYVADLFSHAIRRVRPVQCDVANANCVPVPVSLEAQYLVDTPYGLLGQSGYVDWPSANASTPGEVRIERPFRLAYVETTQGGRYLFTTSDGGLRLRQIVIVPRSGDTAAPGTVRTVCESGRSKGINNLPNIKDGYCLAADTIDRPSVWFNALAVNVYPAQTGEEEDRIIFYVADPNVPTIWQLDLQTGFATHMIPFGKMGAHDGDFSQATLGNPISLLYSKTFHRIFFVEFGESAVREILPVETVF